MSEFIEPEIETGIPCFVCKKHSGLDCAGRESDEATMCKYCFKKHWDKVCKEQDEYEKAYFEKLRKNDMNENETKMSLHELLYKSGKPIGDNKPKEDLRKVFDELRKNTKKM